MRKQTDFASLCSGSPHSLADRLANAAERWARACGMSLRNRKNVAMTDAAIREQKMTAEQRVLLAVACDLCDILAATPDGRQALADLGLEPFSQDREGE